MYSKIKVLLAFVSLVFIANFAIASSSIAFKSIDTLPAEVTAGEQVSLHYQLVNLSGDPGYPVYYQINAYQIPYATIDTTRSTCDVTSHVTTTPLDPNGGTCDLYINFSVPGDTAPGSYNGTIAEALYEFPIPLVLQTSIVSDTPIPVPPPPPPPSAVSASVTITGDLATLGGQNVAVLLTGATDYPAVNIPADNAVHVFGDVTPGNYIAAPTSVMVGADEYDLKSSGPFTINATTTNISLEYDKKVIPAGSGTLALTVYNDRTFSTQNATSAQTVTFTNLDTQKTTSDTFNLVNGTYSNTYTLANGNYSIALTAPSGYNTVISNGNRVTVLSNTPSSIDADYKYAGTYVYLTPSNYTELLSTKDQIINLGQGLLSYHCVYMPSTTFPYYQYNVSQGEGGCFDKGDFEFPTTVRTIGNTQVSEDVLWALSTAMAAMIERTQIEYGHHPLDGMTNNFPDYHNDAPLYPASNIKAIGQNGINTLGDYLYENISPNYLLSRCLQEGNVLCALTGPGPSGAFQIDSFTSVLSVAEAGGYPMPFSLLKQSYVIGTPGGPFDSTSAHDMSNFVGGVISSAFFDSTNYTPQWATDNAVGLSATLKQSATLPDVMEYFSSILYNQGPASLAQAFMGTNLTQCATYDYASNQQDVRFDGQCFLTSGTGAEYPFQLPDVNHNFLETADQHGGHFYKNSALKWSDISAYLDLIGPEYYGFYDAYDIAQAKKAAQAAFTSLAQSGTTIDFQTQFPTVLTAIMESLPVYLSDVAIGGGSGSANISVFNNSTMTFYVQSSVFNNTILGGASGSIPQGTNIINLQYMNPGYTPCDSSVVAELNTLLADKTVTSISLGFNGACTVSKIS